MNNTAFIKPEHLSRLGRMVDRGVVAFATVLAATPSRQRSAGLRRWRAGECAELQGGDIGCLNGRPGRVSLWRPAVGVATFFGVCKHGTLLIAICRSPWFSLATGGRLIGTDLRR